MAMITVAEAAKHLGVNHMTVRRWISQGLLTAYRVGPKLIRLDLEEVDQLAHGAPTRGSLNYG